jgi:hypothetical protein
MDESDMIKEDPRTSLFHKIRLHWSGNRSLSWAFWKFYFVGGLLLFFLVAIIFLLSIPFVYVENQSIVQSPKFQVVLILIAIIYICHATISVVMVWRCGANEKSNWLKYLSRAYMVGWIYNWLRVIWLIA